MLDKTQLVDMFDRLGTPRQGRELIMKARSHAPVRDVKSRGGNVITLMASQKMGCEIRTESRHIEFAAAVEREYDAQVLEYYAQPTELKLDLIDPATGEIRRITHFPDFLVIRQDGFTLEEWKSESKLERLAEKYPYRFKKGSDGRWYSPQIEKQLAELGIGYRIFSDLDLPRRRVDNLLHLADYFHPAAPPCEQEELVRLNAVLAQQGCLHIAELMAQPFKFSADTLLKAIADNVAVADLDHELLSEPRRSRLYRDTTLRDFVRAEQQANVAIAQERFVFEIAEGVRFLYETQQMVISLVGEKDVVCRKADGATLSLTRTWLTHAFESGQIIMQNPATHAGLDLVRHSQEALNSALHRQAILNDAEQKHVSERTMRRWLARQRAATANGANDVLALVPRTTARGNRSERLSAEQVDMMHKIYETKWRTTEAKNYKNCHRELQVACDAIGIQAPSYPTLINYIKTLQSESDVRTRHGKRMAYQNSEWTNFLHYDTPMHGSRPFQYIHVDHTQLDIELISSRSDKPLGRPWLSLAVDSFTRRIVALYLTYDPPSYRSVMMVMRDLVNRHERLPEFVVVDNGRDFMSEAFESFLQVMGVHLRFRPAGQPRHGAVLERMFGRAHSEYVHNLAGNTKGTKNVRSLSGSHLPEKFAEWTLESMYCGLQAWAFDYYNQQRHPALDCSPIELHAKGIRDSGARPQRQILFNQDFLIATCPSADRGGVRKVHRQHGIKVNDMFYWNAEFRDHRVSGQNLQVRYDPWDASSAYVRLKNQWVHARCRAMVQLGQLTETERKALTEEYRKHSKEHHDDEKAMQRLREFMQVFKPEGAMQIAMERQQENKSLYNQLKLSSINPVTQPMKTFLEDDTSAHVIASDISTIEPSFTAISSATTEPEPLPKFEEF
ncbi:Mu transposase C-terminal domain-containing protein [Oxalicibacterium faecigallinarum]|nr:DDE-type integrase/transposase/recombinase [Oxalicibacterium faecigallinarum]